nr:hypothetical protein [uncultured Shimia sp.]
MDTSYNIPGREEFEGVDEAALQKHVHDLRWAVYDNEQTACEGYVQRMLQYQERTGRIVSPYEMEG